MSVRGKKCQTVFENPKDKHQLIYSSYPSISWTFLSIGRNPQIVLPSNASNFSQNYQNRNEDATYFDSTGFEHSETTESEDHEVLSKICSALDEKLSREIKKTPLCC